MGKFNKKTLVGRFKAYLEDLVNAKRNLYPLFSQCVNAYDDGLHLCESEMQVIGKYNYVLGEIDSTRKILRHLENGNLDTK